MAAEKLRKYELIYILQPEVTDEGRERVEKRIFDVFEKMEGHLLKKEDWGKRKLAYEINKQTKGVYCYLVFAAKPGLTAEVERNLRLMDDCIRFQTIKLEDGLTLEAVLAEKGQAEEAESESSDDAAEAAPAAPATTETAAAETPKAEEASDA